MDRSPADQSHAPILVLVEDLFFVGRISAAAGRAGIAVAVMTPADLIPTNVSLALVDLHHGGDWETAVRRMRAAGATVIGFGQHTNGPLLKRGRAVGCSRVMARSKLVECLPKIMDGYRRDHRLPGADTPATSVD